jgi:hypothetical protein
LKNQSGPKALVWIWPLSALLWACGSPPESKEPEAALIVDPATAPPLERVDVAVTELKRADVVRVVEAGFGKFLQDAELEVEYVDGRYVGYRIVRIQNPERYRGVGLEPGDVITQINGKSIEREEQAFEVFRSLRDAPYLEVSYLRQGEPMRLSLPIVGEAEPSAPAGSVPAGGGTPASPNVSPSTAPTSPTSSGTPNPSTPGSSATNPQATPGGSTGPGSSAPLPKAKKEK